MRCTDGFAVRLPLISPFECVRRKGKEHQRGRLREWKKHGMLCTWLDTMRVLVAVGGMSYARRMIERYRRPLNFVFSSLCTIQAVRRRFSGNRIMMVEPKSLFIPNKIEICASTIVRSVLGQKPQRGCHWWCWCRLLFLPDQTWSHHFIISFNFFSFGFSLYHCIIVSAFLLWIIYSAMERKAEWVWENVSLTGHIEFSYHSVAAFDGAMDPTRKWITVLAIKCDAVWQLRFVFFPFFW